MSQTTMFGVPEKTKRKAKETEDGDSEFQKMEPPVIHGVVVVEAQTSPKKYRVDLDAGTCTCTCAAPPNEVCFHRRKAFDVHREKAKSTRYEIVSALHKEIRRGDVEMAMYWGDLLSRHSDYYVTRYIRQIVGEETRNWDLFMKATFPPKDWTFRDFVFAIASSRKKWEHPKVCRPFKEHLLAFERVTDEIIDLPGDVLVEKAKVALAKGEFSDLYDAWAAIDCKEDSETQDLFDAWLIEQAIRVWPGFETAPQLFELYEKKTQRDIWEIRLTMVEAIVGAWDESMNEYIHDADKVFDYSDGRLLRRFPDYVYDRHLIQGRRRLEKLLHRLEPMKPQPENLDMRWSGQFYGVAWRYAAFAQFGFDYVNTAWEDVKMTPAYWKAAVAMSEATDGG